MKSYPSVDQLKEEVDYDKTTGIFTRKKTHPKLKYRVGDITGVTRPDGYLQISIKGKIFLAHRLAWLYVHGEVPSSNIDHIDGNKSNNEIQNLRSISQCANVQNIKKAKSNNKSTGILGVSLMNKGKGKKKFRARIVVDGKEKSLGGFETPEEAHLVYIDAKRKYHEGCVI
jgi:hypothetical protein